MRVSEAALAGWNEISGLHRDYIIHLNDFCQKHREEVVGVVELSFKNPMDASIGLAILPTLSESERQALLPFMLSLCSSAKYAHLARPFIVDLPRQWLLENIEQAAEHLLGENDFLDWVNLQRFYQDLDSGLAWRLAKRMSLNPDDEIREWGRDYLKDTGSVGAEQADQPERAQPS